MWAGRNTENASRPHLDLHVTEERPGIACCLYHVRLAAVSVQNRVKSTGIRRSQQHAEHGALRVGAYAAMEGPAADPAYDSLLSTAVANDPAVRLFGAYRRSPGAQPADHQHQSLHKRESPKELKRLRDASTSLSEKQMKSKERAGVCLAGTCSGDGTNKNTWLRRAQGETMMRGHLVREEPGRLQLPHPKLRCSDSPRVPEISAMEVSGARRNETLSPKNLRKRLNRSKTNTQK